MNISDQIGSSHVEAMKKILAFILSFNVSKLLYAICAKRMDEETIRSITLDIRLQNLRLDRQMEYLFKFGKTFNKEWATYDNKCFDTAARLSFKMRSGIKGIKKSVMAFCKRSRRRLKPGEVAPQAIDCTLIAANQEYMGDLFGLESYPDYVKELFQEMINFHENLYNCLEESLRVLSEEKEIRDDQRRCLELLQEALAKSRLNMITLVKSSNTDSTLKKALLNSPSYQPNDSNPVLKEWENSRNSEARQRAFAAAFFHNCSPEEVGRITIRKTITEAEGDLELVSCMTIFNCTREKALRINHVISSFDSLLPAKCKNNKIPSPHLFVFMRWCSEGVGYKSFLNYFNKRYKASGGRLELIGDSALCGASAQRARSTQKYKSVEKDMIEKLNKMFPPESVQKTA